MTPRALKISSPLFRWHQWQLRSLATVQIVGEPVLPAPGVQVDVAEALIQGWPLAVTVRRLAGGAYRPMGWRSAEVLGAILAHRDPERCAVWVAQDDHEMRLTHKPEEGAESLAAILDPQGQWDACERLRSAGHAGQANRLRSLAYAWNDYPLAVHEVLDLPGADEIEDFVNRYHISQIPTRLENNP